MSLLNPPVLQFVDADGAPLAFAKAYLYLTGTTTPVDTFADAEMTEAHTFPVVADSQGLFPPIYFEGDVLVRMKLVTAAGDLVTPLLDVDPVNQLFTVFAANIADGAIEEKLGYTPVNPAAAVFTANARLDMEEPGELNPDDIGYRGNPVTIKNVEHTFELADSQRLIVKDDTGDYVWTIPADTFPIGHYFEIWIANTGTVSLERDTGVTLRAADNSTDENKDLQPYYRGRLQQVASNDWVLSPDVAGDVALSVNGYFILPNGYIRQWGTYTGSLAGDAVQNVVFPFEFPTACLGATVTLKMGGTPEITADMGCAVNAFDATDLDVYISGPADEVVDGFIWEAWGY